MCETSRHIDLVSLLAVFAVKHERGSMAQGTRQNKNNGAKIRREIGANGAWLPGQTGVDSAFRLRLLRSCVSANGRSMLVNLASPDSQRVGAAMKTKNRCIV